MKPEKKIPRLFYRLIEFMDPGSLKLRLWGYFGLFAVTLVLILWILQVVFLSYYYEDMKLRETERIVANIENMIQRDTPLTEVRAYVMETYRESGIYIQIEPMEGWPLVIPFVSYEDQENATDASGNEIEELPAERPGSFYPTVYRNEIDNLKKQLIDSGLDIISKQTIEPETERKTLEYAIFLKMPSEQSQAEPGDIALPDLLPDEFEGSAINSALPVQEQWILFVFSPLYPQESTSQILTEQLVYVTIIAVLLSTLLGFYLSRTITKPLEEITKHAEDLAAGNYDIDFQTSSPHYSEVAQLADTLAEASCALAETRTMQRDIIANVSHDLKTPLTMIRSYAEMINDLSGDDPAKRARHLQVIMEETDRLSAMITELLDISKLQSGELSLRVTAFSLKELIQSTIDAYQAYIEQGGYRLIFFSIGDGLVNADEMRIKQVLDNLISNALKYGGKDKIVEVRMIEKEDAIRVEVTDHGIGISRRDLKHVWERYYQTSTLHSRTGSTGLGLSIVKEILILHGARFGVESTIRQGSTFWFEIPIQGIEA